LSIKAIKNGWFSRLFCVKFVKMEIFFLMESFGLFDLLKSLLFFNGERDNSAFRPSQPTPPSTQSQPCPEKKSATPEVDNAPLLSTQTAPAPNAYLDFLHRHDERAKRHRK
jgi:hypothetical protein